MVTRFRSKLNSLITLAFIVSFYTLCIVIATALNQYVYQTVPELAYWFIPLAASCIISAISIYVWRRLRETDALRYEFITIVAHKFRTPLTHIKWVCEELVSTEQNNERKQSLLAVYSSNENLIDFTGMIIQAADTDVVSGKTYLLSQHTISELVNGVIDTVSKAFQMKKIKLKIDIPDDIAIFADDQRMKFVFQTLLENAHAYTPEGGTVTISARLEKNRAVIRVSDTGIGINPEDISKLFSKFYRTNKAMHTDTEGFGIGLYLVKTIIEKHRGKIEVHSNGENTGTTFKVILPALN